MKKSAAAPSGAPAKRRLREFTAPCRLPRGAMSSGSPDLFLVPRHPRSFLGVCPFPELSEIRVFHLLPRHSIHQRRKPSRWRLRLVLRDDEAQVEQRLEDDEHAKKIPVRSGKHD